MNSFHRYTARMDTSDVKQHYGTVKTVCTTLDITERTFYNWQRDGIPNVWQMAIAWKTAGRLVPRAERASCE